MRGLNPELTKQTLESLQKESKIKFLALRENRGMPVAEVDPDQLIPLMTLLKSDSRYDFNILMDLTAIDYLESFSKNIQPPKPKRFDVSYLLFSLKSLKRIQVKVPVNEGEKVPSLVRIWKAANWPEREVFDLFGITFEGHPLMERLIMPDGYIGHPLRKDFPLKGRGEDYLIESILRPVKEEFLRAERESRTESRN